ncbi:MAG: decarboxylating 6-phosphogluconate dehydrogenase [Fimbriimonadales bacterium]|jgi:6-phosphogluconate dehydrogenase|nr:decarboxylating 6-phosphogluconate dehydrogenase [Fimbriimonadales bacterium]GBC91424.1 6-phosphogluconate dehydrogenase, NAD(+)-dependent, decarboxylating [bacterium HR14]
MELGMIGLGRMGGNMARRLAQRGHRVVGYSRTRATVDEYVPYGIVPAYTPEEAVAALKPPRILWFMYPAGEPTEQAIFQFAELLNAGDLVVNGANSYYRDSMRYAARLQERGILFADVGVSGGVWGLENGYGLMVGGAPEVVARIEPLLRDLAPAPDKGWVHVGPVGAGHYAKMIHNGIEYGIMQAYAEGFELLRRKTEFQIDLAKVAEAWRYGTVIRSWLLDLIAGFLKEDAQMAEVAPYVADSGEGRWTAQEAIELGCPAPVITHALHERFRSQDSEGFQYRFLAQLRKAFGGHAVKKASE